jgi:hypothetical protein
VIFELGGVLVDLTAVVDRVWRRWADGGVNPDLGRALRWARAVVDDGLQKKLVAKARASPAQSVRRRIGGLAQLATEASVRGVRARPPLLQRGRRSGAPNRARLSRSRNAQAWILVLSTPVAEARA